jgi:hypothetical protein
MTRGRDPNMAKREAKKKPDSFFRITWWVSILVRFPHNEEKPYMMAKTAVKDN